VKQTQQARVVWGVLIVAAALSAVACKGDGGNGDTTATGQAPVVAAKSGVATKKTNPDKPYDQMTPDEFKAYVDQLDFSSGTANEEDRKCRPNSGDDCRGANPKIKVKVKPEKDAEFIQWDNIHANGQVIAKLENKGKGIEDVLNLPGQKEDIYWLVEQGHSRFIAVYDDKAVTTEVRSEFSFVKCHDTNSGLEAGFQVGDCGKAHSKGRPEADAPPWVSCAAGCCVAKNQPEPPGKGGGPKKP
jgi:hypothetical protein